MIKKFANLFQLDYRVKLDNDIVCTILRPDLLLLMIYLFIYFTDIKICSINTRLN